MVLKQGWFYLLGKTDNVYGHFQLWQWEGRSGGCVLPISSNELLNSEQCTGQGLTRKNWRSTALKLRHPGLGHRQARQNARSLWCCSHGLTTSNLAVRSFLSQWTSNVLRHSSDPVISAATNTKKCLSAPEQTGTAVQRQENWTWTPWPGFESRVYHFLRYSTISVSQRSSAGEWEMELLSCAPLLASCELTHLGDFCKHSSIKWM